MGNHMVRSEVGLFRVQFSLCFKAMCEYQFSFILKLELLGLIHDGHRHALDFKLSCKLAMCYARCIHRKKANCGKSARRNVKITLFKEHFIIKIAL